MARAARSARRPRVDPAGRIARRQRPRPGPSWRTEDRPRAASGPRESTRAETHRGHGTRIREPTSSRRVGESAPSGSARNDGHGCGRIARQLPDRFAGNGRRVEPALVALSLEHPRPVLRLRFDRHGRQRIRPGVHHAPFVDWSKDDSEASVEIGGGGELDCIARTHDKRHAGQRDVAAYSPAGDSAARRWSRLLGVDPV